MTGVPRAVPRVARVSPGHELLDGPLDDPVALAGNLRDLARVNRWLGGARLSCRAVEALLGDAETAAILDVGTGAADIPLALIDAGRRQGRTWTVTAVDSRPEVIEAARTFLPAADAADAADAAARLVLGVVDGQSLPYPDAAFAVSHASLLIHHLGPGEVMALLGELARVAQDGVVVNDLVRSPLTHAGAWLTSRLFTTNRYTRHDAPLSARRAYSRGELRALVEAAGLRVVADFGAAAGHRRALAAVRA